jgi:hypothetical protein
VRKRPARGAENERSTRTHPTSCLKRTEQRSSRRLTPSNQGYQRTTLPTNARPAHDVAYQRAALRHCSRKHTSLHQLTCLHALEQQHLASIPGSSVLLLDRRGRKLAPSSTSPHHGPDSRLGARPPATDHLALGPNHPTVPAKLSSCAKGMSSSEGSRAPRRSGGDSVCSFTYSASPCRSQAGTDKAALYGL